MLRSRLYTDPRCMLLKNAISILSLPPPNGNRPFRRIRESTILLRTIRHFVLHPRLPVAPRDSSARWYAILFDRDNWIFASAAAAYRKHSIRSNVIGLDYRSVSFSSRIMLTRVSQYSGRDWISLYRRVTKRRKQTDRTRFRTWRTMPDYFPACWLSATPQ